MICIHLVWELFDRKKKHRGLCQINGLNPQCLWVNRGVERSRTFIYPLNTIRYWISFVWVSISKFKTTPQIRVRCIYSNQIEFWVLIYYKFNATALMVLIEVLLTVPITIEDWRWSYFYVMGSSILICIELYDSSMVNELMYIY